MLELRAQTGPVFLTYEASSAVDAVGRARRRTAQPLFDFTAPDGVQHTIWTVDARDERELVAAFAAIPALYIADGHHRAASAARARQQLRGAKSAPRASGTRSWPSPFPTTRCRSCRTTASSRISARSRRSRCWRRLRERFTVTEGRPPRRGAARSRCSSAAGGTRSRSARRRADLDAADRLDVSRLQDTVLTPLLGHRRRPHRQAHRLRRRRARDRRAREAGACPAGSPSRSRCIRSASTT